MKMFSKNHVLEALIMKSKSVIFFLIAVIGNFTFVVFWQYKNYR